MTSVTALLFSESHHVYYCTLPAFGGFRLLWLLSKLCVKPQVAEVVGVHETTVSRAVSGKYMQTPQGVFEMKYFFTSGIQTATGEGMSNTSVKDMIADIFKNEDPLKPLSDQEVVMMLSAKGIVIARRTVAKYRSELNILPSNLRKVY